MSGKHRKNEGSRLHTECIRASGDFLDVRVSNTIGHPVTRELKAKAEANCCHICGKPSARHIGSFGFCKAHVGEAFAHLRRRMG